MSVDTTVLVLKCLDGFRVNTVGAAENITEGRDAELVKSLFGHREVYPTLELAMKAAHEEEEEHTKLMGYPSEYGIRVFVWDQPI